MSSKEKSTDKLDPAGGNVEQIREILFGGHIRAFDERFDLVESRLAKESATLRKALEKRVLEVEKLLGEYREEAGDQLSSETSNRDLALNKIELALASARMDAENQMAQLEDSLGEEIKAAKAEFKAAQKELSLALKREEKAREKVSEKLAEEKVDRKELSKYLGDLAKKILPDDAKKGK